MARMVPCATVLLLIAGCISAPTTQQMANADYGSGIGKEDAEKLAHDLMQEKLKDPYSAVWACGTPVHDSMNDGKAFGNTAFGWVLYCDINSKNSFGAYAGSQRFGFLFYNGNLVRAAVYGSQGLFATQQIIFSR